MTDKTFNVLFLCTGNSARSVMAEALVTTMGHGRFQGYSAGSFPNGTVNPFAIEHTNYPVTNLRSKSWDEFAAADAPHMDFIITVCDNAAGEVCPIWPGHPLTAHWGFEDPAALNGSDEEKRALFHKVFRQIMARISIFVSLPLSMLEKNAIHQEMKKIGETLGRVDIIFGQCVLSKTQDGKAHLAAAASRPSKRCNAVHRVFCQEPFGNGRNGHMALLQAAYSARTAARLDA